MSTSSNNSKTKERPENRSYDLYAAELDVAKEKRTQRHLAGISATHIICLCPLMILR